MNTQLSTRSERERAASDESNMYQQWENLRRRWLHIFQCPNTQWGERQLASLLGQAVPGKSVLEIGCGSGGNAKDCIVPLGPTYVLAVDISHTLSKMPKRKGRYRACLNMLCLMYLNRLSGSLM